jgi:hypothetical protein
MAPLRCIGGICFFASHPRFDFFSASVRHPIGICPSTECVNSHRIIERLDIDRIGLMLSYRPHPPRSLA